MRLLNVNKDVACHPLVVDKYCLWPESEYISIQKHLNINLKLEYNECNW